MEKARPLNRFSYREHLVIRREESNNTDKHILSSSRL
jgi:hypothetical protein